ncbi:type II secretion system protein GspK [Caulobacter sp. CCUG 60055]|nr:general secretion pathway protein GspK [Caulobacteraceae bacterium]
MAALTALLLFALMAYTVLAADQGATAGAQAQMQRARLEAAADGALATAIAGLGASDARRWAIGGRPRDVEIDGVQTTIVIEDERGKVPLNRLQPTQARRLLQAAGVAGPRLDALTDSLLSWQDGFSRDHNATLLDYAADDVRPRGALFVTVGELAAVKGMTPALLDRLAPVLTVFPGNGAFMPQAASPLALAAMTETGAEGPDAIIRARELAGQRAKLDTATESYVGRVVTVHVTARAPGGGALDRSAVVELTGNAHRPFWVRATD